MACFGKVEWPHCDWTLESWLVKGNHLQMAQHFRLVKYDNLSGCGKPSKKRIFRFWSIVGYNNHDLGWFIVAPKCLVDGTVYDWVKQNPPVNNIDHEWTWPVFSGNLPSPDSWQDRTVNWLEGKPGETSPNYIYIIMIWIRWTCWNHHTYSYFHTFASNIAYSFELSKRTMGHHL